MRKSILQIFTLVFLLTLGTLMPPSLANLISYNTDTQGHPLSSRDVHRTIKKINWPPFQRKSLKLIPKTPPRPVPSVPKVPNVPNVPSISPVPNVPNVPKVPSVPNVPPVPIPETPNPGIAVAGSTHVLVGTYRFTAQWEPIVIQKLTVINDLSGAFDNPIPTGAVTDVSLQYTDQKGTLQTSQAPLSQGSATLTGLSIYVPRNNETVVRIYANIVSYGEYGEGVSGLTFRLGLRDTGNTAGTYEAVGFYSNETISSLGRLNNSTLKTFVVRKSKPIFSQVPSTTTLINDENTLYGFKVTADKAGPVSVARLVFDLATSHLDQAGNDLNNFHFFLGSTPLSSVNIYGIDGALQGQAINLRSQGLHDVLGNAGIASVPYKIIVSFNEDEIISAGKSNHYYLKASVIGARRDAFIFTRIASTDEEDPVSGLRTDFGMGSGNANTGRIYSQFQEAGLFSGDPENFSKSAPADRNIIWSDRSANPHFYPSITQGVLERTDEGSYDWTNGYHVGISGLKAQELKY